MIENNFLDSSIRLFKYYQGLAESAMSQVNEAQLFQTPSPESNSIAIIAKHLAGNMLSRWTDFLESDGEKPWRNRDQEFENDFKKKEELYEYWHNGWNCLYNALEQLKPSDLDRIIYIRNEGHTVMDAITRQLCHYSHHSGQIVFLSKFWADQHWKSLSIPKNNSAAYNAAKFEEPKSVKHFTDKV
jgi:hypothetical protein